LATRMMEYNPAIKRIAYTGEADKVDVYTAKAQGIFDQVLLKQDTSIDQLVAFTHQHLGREQEGQKPDYAFLVHPRNIADVKENWPISVFIGPEQLSDEVQKSGTVVAGEIRRQGEQDYGLLIAALFIPQEFTTRRHGIAEASKKLIEAGDFAYELGCKFMGLGGLSAALTGYGTKFKDKPYVITTGHSVTAWNINQNIDDLQKLALTRPLDILVLGANGSMGRLVTEYRLTEPPVGRKIYLADVDSSMEALQTHHQERLGEYLQIVPSSERLAYGDILVSVTNADRVLFDIVDVPPGKILLDDAQPWCWDRETAYRRFMEQGDILPLDAGLTASRGRPFSINADLGLPKQAVFSCLAEVYLLSKFPGRLSPTVGIIKDQDDAKVFSNRLKQFGAVATADDILRADWQCGPHTLDPGRVLAFFEQFYSK